MVSCQNWPQRFRGLERWGVSGSILIPR